MQLCARKQPDVAEVGPIDGRSIGCRGGRDARRRLRIHAQGDRPGRRAVVEDAEHDSHVARSTAGGTTRLRAGVALQVQAQRVGQAIVREQSLGRTERLPIDFRAQPGVPADVQVIGVVAEAGLDGAVLVGRETDRVARFPAADRTAEIDSTDRRCKSGEFGRPRPAPDRQGDFGGAGDPVGGNGHRFLQIGDPPHGVLLQRPANGLVEHRRDLAHAEVNLAVGPVRIDEAGKELARLRVDAIVGGREPPTVRKNAVDVQTVVGVQQHSASRLVDDAEDAVDGLVDVDRAVDFTRSGQSLQGGAADAPGDPVAAVPLGHVT